MCCARHLAILSCKRLQQSNICRCFTLKELQSFENDLPHTAVKTFKFKTFKSQLDSEEAVIVFGNSLRYSQYATSLNILFILHSNFHPRVFPLYHLSCVFALHVIFSVQRYLS